MSIELPEKASPRTEQVLVRLKEGEKRRFTEIAEEIEVPLGVLGRHAILAFMEGYDGDKTPTPAKKRRSKKP